MTSVWSGETQAGAIAMVKQEFEPIVVGADPFDLEWICRRMDKAVHANSFAKAAVEMALLDLQGQILGVPVYKLLGGKAHAPALQPTVSVNATSALTARQPSSSTGARRRTSAITKRSPARSTRRWRAEAKGAAPP